MPNRGAFKSFSSYAIASLSLSLRCPPSLFFFFFVVKPNFRCSFLFATARCVCVCFFLMHPHHSWLIFSIIWKSRKYKFQFSNAINDWIFRFLYMTEWHLLKLCNIVMYHLKRAHTFTGKWMRMRMKKINKNVKRER